MNLNVSEWKRFQIGRLFEIKKGKRLTADDQIEGCNLYIGAIDSNNGVANHIGQFPIHSGNTLTLSYNGSVGEAFYQPEPYWATDDVNALYSKYDGFNEKIGLFLATVIKKEKYKFSYGRKWTLENMKSTEICLPIKKNSEGQPYIGLDKKYSDEGYEPDWDFMEAYITSLNHQPITTGNHDTEVDEIKISEWQDFIFGRLISKIYKASAINKDDVIEATNGCDSIRYITRTGNDNGCEMLADLSSVPSANIEAGNAISIGDTTATCFYQAEPFVTGDHMVVVRADWMNELNALYIVCLLTKEQFKYSYGRAFLMDKIKDTVIKLPILKDKAHMPVIDAEYQYSDDGYIPDWEYMEKYIRSLLYGDRI